MQTPEQKRAKQKAYREANKEKIQKRRKKNYDNNKNKIKENGKCYYEANKDKIKEREKTYRESNKEKIKIKNINYSIKNKEKIRETSKNWYNNNKGKTIEKSKKNYFKKKKKINDDRDAHNKKVRQYVNKRIKTDSLYKLREGVRGLIKSSIRNSGYKKNTKTEQILGCTFEFFKQYLEAQFNEWQNWSNWGAFKRGEIAEPNKYWQIDHIIPLCSAKTEEDVIRLNHYTNLQVLDAYINLITKGSKLDYYK